MGRRFNDLESGFEKYLALAYGTHIITGFSLFHSIGLESGGGNGQEGLFYSALGDGAYNEAGEGAWGICSSPGSPECSEDLLARAVYESLTNITEQEDGELEKTGGTPVTYDANAYSITWEGTHCFDIRWEATESKHTQLISILIEDTSATPSSRNGWQMNEASGSIPVCNTIVGGSFGGDVSYTFPQAFRISSDGSGNGSLQLGNGSGGWGLGTGFTYDTSKTYRIRVAIGGLDGIPVATAPVVLVSAGAPVPIFVCRVPKRVLYSGFDIPIETNVHYHPGTISFGEADPIQGVDPWFPGGLTYSATPSVGVLLPEGIDEEADGSKLAIILDTSSIADYDSSGNLISIGPSFNPARIKADALKRRGQHHRIDWDSFIHARDFNDGLLDWEAGDTTNTYISFTGVPEFVLSGNISVVDITGALSKTSEVDGYDNQALTKERILAGTTGHYEWTIGSSFPNFTDGGSVYLVDSSGVGYYGIVWGNGHYAQYANGVPVDKKDEPYPYPGTNGDVNEIGVDGSGNFYWKKNSILMSIPQGVAPAPFDKDLFVKVVLYESTASISLSEFSGKRTNTTSNNVTQVKRFEAHPAFTSPIDLGTLLDYVDLLSASDTQEAGKKIFFLTPEPRIPIHDFDEDTNVIGDIETYEIDIRLRPNRLWATFRNLDTQFLEKDSVFSLRDDLFNRVGRPIDPGAYNFAGMSASQAQRLIEYRMRIDSDNFRWCNLKGDHSSIKVLPAHVVRVISREYWVEVDESGFDDSSTEILLREGESENFRLSEMEIPFFATVWNLIDTNDPDLGQVNPKNDPDREVIQVTDVDGDILTIVRGQQGTTAKDHNTPGKIYVIGRIPKKFKVINATRDNAETTPLTRDFILQEYYPDDYRDTDHRPHQQPSSLPVPSPFDCPPIPILELEQKTTEAVGGTITKIIGTVYFGTYAYTQSAKVFVSKDGGTEEDTGLVVNPSPGTTNGMFQYTAEDVTTYSIRVQVISGAGKPCGSVTKEITLTTFISEDGTGNLIVEDGTGLFILEDQ